VRRYVEADKRLRTKFGKKARLGAPGAGGCKGSVFSDLLVAHFGAGRVGTYAHQLDSNEFMAMRALGPDGIFIQVFEILFVDPHQFEASWTGFDLRHQHPFHKSRQLPSEGLYIIQDGCDSQDDDVF